MRDLNRLEMSLALLAMYVWLWIDAVVRAYRWASEVPQDLRDFAATVRENERGLRRGAADLDWQRTLHALAAPIRERRIIEESGEHAVTLVEHGENGEPTLVALPALAVQAYTGVTDIAPLYREPVPVVTATGTVVDTIPTPVEHIRKHRVYDHAPEQRRPRKVATKAKQALLSPVGAPEVRAAEERVRRQLDRVVAEAMRALGLSADEAQDILGLWSFS